jgi:hypothetical protein
MRVRRPILSLSFTLLCIVGSASAQASHVDFSAGAGFSEPAGRGGNNVDTGWNLDFRGGYKPIALDLDFNYNRWNLNGRALARLRRTKRIQHDMVSKFLAFPAWFAALALVSLRNGWTRAVSPQSDLDYSRTHQHLVL